VQKQKRFFLETQKESKETKVPKDTQRRKKLICGSNPKKTYFHPTNKATPV
jgi:hypothetical protein